jgi:hypothetical protein
MPKYILRVEIPNFDDFETLHQELAKYDFYRVIQANDGVYYDLPAGTYRLQAGIDIQAAHHRAELAVSAVVSQFTPHKKYELIVSHYVSSKSTLNVTTDVSKLPR